ncbi:hypothetical protein IWZ01DRAFT_538201 [Phyllosticta capitalensis]
MASSTSNTASNQPGDISSIPPLPVPPGWTLLADRSRPVNAVRPESWPYTADDFRRADEFMDSSFYSTPRFVTHIDEPARWRLSQYYAASLPRGGRILDFCSSWTSHYPPEIRDAVIRGDLEVLGTGMNVHELQANPFLAKRMGAVYGLNWPVVHDLNIEPDLSAILDETHEMLDAATCAVSIDYLTQPREVMSSLRRRVKVGGVVHLVLSNRFFPTKAINMWLRTGEEQHLDIVADYLSFSGWSRIEVLQSWVPGTALNPLWVVRGVNAG